ncbi:hypothetical protein [Streptomyces sp. MP131-18]|uniref:hypothetical protein n=1 Tax=Streptomyces sp. MP131-18 TaxID=1857892 RepID=UPI00097BFC11|nr:hypothetical protein [Streptomyces sp. MP131-18]ONK09504.1 hypothetical protein STBA_02040 [Streptomyces sp. MP131-18]
MTAPSSQTTGRTPDSQAAVGANPTSRPRRSSAGTRRRKARAADLAAGRLLEQRHQLDPTDAAYRHLATPGTEVAA